MRLFFYCDVMHRRNKSYNYKALFEKKKGNFKRHIFVWFLTNDSRLQSLRSYKCAIKPLKIKNKIIKNGHHVKIGYTILSHKSCRIS